MDSKPKLTRSKTFKDVMFLKRQFEELDVNGDAAITAEEFASKENKDSVFSGKVKQHIFDIIDKNKDHVIVFTEFLQSYFPKAPASEIQKMAEWAYPSLSEEQRKAKDDIRKEKALAEAKATIFDVFDENKDGILDATELSNLGYDHDEIQNLLYEYDDDDDGALSLQEFNTMYIKEYVSKEVH